MRLLKYTSACLILITFLSCQEKINQKEDAISKIKSIEHIELTIEGMTCEIGCAKLIESKIHKLEGVTFSKVYFEHKKGQFSFDSNQISKEELAKNINGIAGGDLYKVTQTLVVEQFSTADAIPQNK